MQTEELYSIFKRSAGIATDSRNIKPGEIFFALWGENHNGNKYAHEALKNGASYAVIDDPDFENEKTILVDDSLMELQALAAHHRMELKIPVLAVTGTNGKTTTKELITAVLSKKYKVHSTRGNLNNHIGVPLTILSAAAGTEIMIVEMGANHIGEIRVLCEIAMPDHGIITNIGTAHIEGFGSEEGVIKAKTELYEYLKKVNGIALYNEKNHLLTDKIFKLVIKAVPYSDPDGTDLITEIDHEEIKLSIAATHNHRTYNIKTNLFGSYNLENVRAAIATGLFFEVKIEEIISAIENYKPANNRSEIRTTRSNTLICDSYNSNPSSLLKAIDSFIQVKADNRVCILGDMLELGDRSEEEHLNVLKLLKTKGLERVYLVGAMFSKHAASFGFNAFRDVDELTGYLKQAPLKDNLILIKGSRGMRLEKIYDSL